MNIFCEYGLINFWCRALESYRKTPPRANMIDMRVLGKGLDYLNENFFNCFLMMKLAPLNVENWFKLHIYLKPHLNNLI